MRHTAKTDFVMATINVEQTTRDELKEYCRKQDLTQGDFVKYALSYFKKSGINPSEPPQSIKEELSKIEKRISQLIGFQKTFERDNLLPLLEALSKTEGKVNLYFSDIPQKLDRTLEGIALIGKATGKLEQTFSNAIQKLYSDLNRLQVETKDTTMKQHKELITKLDIIIEHGAAVGMTGSSIKDRSQKQKK